MARSRMRRFSRRTSGTGKRSRVPAVVLCVVIFLVLCFSISIVIGILLGQRADEVSTAPKYHFDKVEYVSGDKTVKSIEGYHFNKGSSAGDYYVQGIYDFSFCLRHEDGSLDHASEIAEAMGLDAADTASLADVVESIHYEGGRACGYFYVNAFDESNAHLREVLKAYELALISEMTQSGIDEILLVGISVTDENIDEVEEFLARASLSSQKTAIGAEVSLETLKSTEDEVYHAARLKNACDFLALDLKYMTLADADSNWSDDGHRLPSNLETVVDEMQYYIKQYKVRLVFAREYSSIYKTALSLGIVDFQIVGK